ncbi:MAG: ABC transporter permease [Thermoanaerobacteraceae bacterium]|nr:ABC transporter permease [Thermoanaerobacteraceae bacterium]
MGKQLLLNIKKGVTTNIVPVVFTLLCLVGAIIAEASPLFLLSSVTIRLARNLLLVFSLIIPVVTGLGLNFGIVLGAMAAQIALVAVTHWNITGISGFTVAALLSVPISILFGWLTGKVLNQAKGNEMITSMMLGFFANGLYQLLFLFVLGGIIPMVNKTIMLPSGIGIKNTVSLRGIKYALDDVIKIGYDTLSIPILTFIIIALFALVIKFLLQTKLGQELRCVGQDMNIAATSGINVDKMRIIAVILSTVLAAWGQLIHLQNIGILQTYGSHEQVGLFAVASILIGGATVTKATIGQAVLGTFLFHLLFIISPMAGQKLVGEPQVGEYFRAFVAYGVIGISLGLHAWQKQQAKKNELEE